MSKSLRLSEKWFRRGLWLVALVFAGFLIQLGGAIVSDLPRVEQTRTLEDFMDAGVIGDLREQLEAARRDETEASRTLEREQLQLQAAQQAATSARQAFSNWVSTRRATALPEQDQELIRRTHELDALRAAEDDARHKVEDQRQAQLDARQRQAVAGETIAGLEKDARKDLQAYQRGVELRVFGYRLALTLPLLLVAGWLFARKRRSTWWPFVWGFIFFALFAFFVELVPYLPSYGGYVRYGVGIVLTVLVGRYAILALNRYLARQRAAEARPESERRHALSYDTALARLAKGVCPGCERQVDLEDPGMDFCPHCGLGLFDRCPHCNTRKSSFARFCHACGAVAAQSPESVA